MGCGPTRQPPEWAEGGEQHAPFVAPVLAGDDARVKTHGRLADDSRWSDWRGDLNGPLTSPLFRATASSVRSSKVEGYVRADADKVNERPRCRFVVPVDVNLAKSSAKLGHR